MGFQCFRSAMGRLLKKKDPSRKKKKQNGDDGLSHQGAEGTAAKNRAVVSASESRRQPSSRKKLSGASASHQKNYIGKSVQFLREVRAELKKVTWPSRKQTVGSTLVVIVLVMIISLFLGMVDIGLSSLVRVILQ